MPQSLSRLLVHLVFSTKNREALISLEIESELHSYLAGILKNLDCTVIQIGGYSDHVHLFFGLSRSHSISQVVETLKINSSKWIKTKRRRYRDFYWQSGYGVFSVSQSDVETVVHYVRNQVEHHTKISFLDEYRRFLERYQVSYDERYVWD